MLLACIPPALFARYRSIHVQNLAQSAISAATFGASNSLCCLSNPALELDGRDQPPCSFVPGQGVPLDEKSD
jgi:hypothetical protein